MLQIWRVYRSGQFLWVSGSPDDGRDRSGLWRVSSDWAANAVLGIGDTIATMTEIYEFASRFSQTRAGDDAMTISVTLKNMENRLLMTDSPDRAPMRGG